MLRALLAQLDGCSFATFEGDRLPARSMRRLMPPSEVLPASLLSQRRGMLSPSTGWAVARNSTLFVPRQVGQGLGRYRVWLCTHFARAVSGHPTTSTPTKAHWLGVRPSDLVACQCGVVVVVVLSGGRGPSGQQGVHSPVRYCPRTCPTSEGTSKLYIGWLFGRLLPCATMCNAHLSLWCCTCLLRSCAHVCAGVCMSCRMCCSHRFKSHRRRFGASMVFVLFACACGAAGSFL